MIKSINQLITQKCDSRCKTCNIWKLGKMQNEMNIEDFEKLYSHENFLFVEDLCISGGEPTLRLDLPEIMDVIRKYTPHLRMLFLATNANHPDRIMQFVEKESRRVEKLYVCVSLEGDRTVHNKIRGIDSYDLAIESLTKIGKYGDNVQSVISTTISPENCNKHSLEHISQVAQKTNSTYSFRPASLNQNFYHNEEKSNLLLSKKQSTFLMKFINSHNLNDLFLKELDKYLSGKTTIMGDQSSGIKCLAGDISVFIKPNGDIYPCINSRRKIGNKTKGVFIKNYSLGNMEPCPCCTECQVWSMINFRQYGDSLNDNKYKSDPS